MSAPIPDRRSRTDQPVQPENVVMGCAYCHADLGLFDYSGCPAAVAALAGHMQEKHPEKGWAPGSADAALALVHMAYRTAIVDQRSAAAVLEHLLNTLEVALRPVPVR